MQDEACSPSRKGPVRNQSDSRRSRRGVSLFDFYRDFDLVTLNIEESPGLYQRIDAIDAFEYRKAKFRKLPFVLVYRVDDDSVLVTAIHHEARNATHWHDPIPK